MNKLDQEYKMLLEYILGNGVEKETRNGKTRSIFGWQIRHNMQEGFPALTTKKLAFKTMTTELLWFLRGDTSIKYLVDNNCHIWDGDCYRAYLIKVNMQPGTPMGDFLTQEDFINKIKTDDVFAEKWGSLGKIYGSQWRKWDEDSYGGIDQISQLIRSLRETPDSRRMIVSAWNPTYIPHMVLPPCHYSFQVYTRELSLEERRTYRRSKKNISREIAPASEQMLNNSNIPKRAISLMFNMRSNDVPLGLPFNLASYGLLLEIFGKMVNMVPDELIANLGDAHIYKNQINGVKEQLTREPYSLPKLDIHPGILDYELDKLEVGMFKLVNYKSHPSIKMPLSN